MSSHLEELLWATAESRDAQMEAEFLQRYPHLATQLATHQAAVDALRGSRPVSVAHRPFEAPVVRQSAFRAWVVPAAFAALAAIAFGAYQVTKVITRVEPEPKPALDVRQAIPIPPAIARPDVDSAVVEPTGKDPGTSPRPLTPKKEPIVVVGTKALTLLAALDAIESQSGLPIEVMPGVEDEILRLPTNRKDGTLALAPKDMLLLLEQEAAIRLLDGGPDGFLILPMSKVQNAEVEVRPEPPSKKSARPRGNSQGN
ncbi:MAG: hypothetical protein ACR2HJ_08905 [Fimbriimonadales bacterium]